MRLEYGNTAHNYCIAEIQLEVLTLITEVSEGAGTVDLIRVNKIGETELPVVIMFSGSKSTHK